MNKFILCKVKSTDSNMHGQRWMFAKWFSMPVVREWHMHAKCDQNILCGQELWTLSGTANGRTSGQGSCNSTILKLPLEKGIFSPVVLSCRDNVAGINVSFICINDCVTPLSTPWPCEGIWSYWGLHPVSPSALFDSPHSVCKQTSYEGGLCEDDPCCQCNR